MDWSEYPISMIPIKGDSITKSKSLLFTMVITLVPSKKSKVCIFIPSYYKMPTAIIVVPTSTITIQVLTIYKIQC